MIKANEIRIGNYFLIEGEYIKIIGFLKNKIQYYYKKRFVYEVSIKEITPIQLTEEILLKCGFEYKLGDLDLNIKNGLLSYDTKEKKMYLMVGQFAECSETVPCEYLNQLQNLYFCLCGHELNIIFDN